MELTNIEGFALFRIGVQFVEENCNRILNEKM